MKLKVTTLVCAGLMIAAGALSVYAAASLPNLPAQMDITMPVVNGLTFTAATCAGIQTAINSAAAADVNLTHQVILNTVGLVCPGEFTLPAHLGTGWILIKGPNFASLPPSGTRVSLSNTALMPHLSQSLNPNRGGIISMLTNAQRYRIIGVEFVQNEATLYPADWIGTGIRADQVNAATNTGYLVLDRIVLHDTNPAHSSGRGVNARMDAGHFAWIDSICAGIKQFGKEMQCLATDVNSGPILLQNNYLEAAGENVMFCGGVDPDSAAVMPQDITVRLNEFTIPDAWHNPGIVGGFVQKTLFELKCGLRVLIEANDFHNQGGSEGSNVWRMTPRNVFGGGTFVEVSDITARYNRFYHNANGISVFPSDDGNTVAGIFTKHSHRIYFHDNLIYDHGVNCLSGSLCGYWLTGFSGGASHFGSPGHGCTDPTPTCGFEDFIVSHNTVDDLSVGYGSVQFGTTNNFRFDFKDNIYNANGGIAFATNDSSAQFGTNALNYIWSNTWTWLNNTVAQIGNGTSPSQYPQGSGNLYPANTAGIWTNQAARDYTVPAASPAHLSASDGTDRGVNFIAYNAARAGGGGGGGDTLAPATPKGLRLQ